MYVFVIYFRCVGIRVNLYLSLKYYLETLNNYIKKKEFMSFYWLNFFSFRWPGGEPNEPAATDGLHWSWGVTDLLWHVWGGHSSTSVQDSNHPSRSQGKPNTFSVCEYYLTAQIYLMNYHTSNLEYFLFVCLFFAFVSLYITSHKSYLVFHT